jgi:hypothetical protein
MNGTSIVPSVTEEMCPDFEHAAMMIAMLLFVVAVGGEADVEEIHNAIDVKPWELVSRSLAWILELLPDGMELPDVPDEL